MSDTTQTAETTIEVKAEENDEQATAESQAGDPYCCTPGGGGTGADTKP